MKSGFNEEMVQEHIFIVQWKRILLFLLFWDVRNFLINKKPVSTFVSCIYAFLTTSVLKIGFVFNQLFFHILNIEMCKLPSTGKTWKWNIDISLTILLYNVTCAQHPLPWLQITVLFKRTMLFPSQLSA